jgi:riboflavin kinase/FMN adenylyltransferase
VLDGATPGAHRAALSVGSNPTFTSATGGGITVEAHLLDFAGDLYGRRLRLEVLHRLRDERRFDSIEALKAQIALDIVETRERLAEERARLP